MLGIVALFLCLALASPAWAQPDGAGRTQVAPGERGAPLLLRPGARSTVTLDAQWRIATIAEDAAPQAPQLPPAMTGLTSEKLFAFSTGPFDAKPGELVFTLWSDRQNGARLKLDNGLDRDAIYVAALLIGELKPQNLHLTTICATAAGRSGFELWPEPVDAIAIIRVFEPPASDATICVDPTANEKEPSFYTLEE